MKADPQAFSDDDAEHFADAFKPAWDTPDEDSTAVSAPPSAVAAQAAAEAAVSIAPVVSVSAEAPAAVASVAPLTREAKMRTVIGMAAPPPPLAPETIPIGLSAEVTPKEMTAPAAMPFSSATSSPNVAGVAAGAGVYTMGMGTQVMNNRPALPGAPGYVASRPPPAPVAPVAAAVTADPFRTRAGSSSDFDAYKPRKSNKAIVIGVIGVMALIGLGVGLKAAISDDPTDKPKTEPLVTGPAATTAEIPPPPPATDPAPAAKTAEPTSTTTTAAATQTPPPPPPAPLAVPTQPHVAQPPPPQTPPPPAQAAQPAAPRNDRNDSSRGRAPAPPPAPPPAAAKSPTKPGNGGIVRDNPF